MPTSLDLDPWCSGGLVFTLGWVDRPGVPPGSTTVEIEIDAAERGSLVTLTHRHLPDEEIEPHTAGWRHYVVRLGTAAEGKDLEPDQGPSG